MRRKKGNNRNTLKYILHRNLEMRNPERCGSEILIEKIEV